MHTDTARARDALHSIPPDLPRDEWVRVGMAAQAAGLDFDDWDAWSAQAGNYDARAAADTWRSFKPGKGVGAGTVYREAAEHGWRMGAGKPQQHGPSKAPIRPPEPPRKPRPGMGPEAVWGRCEPATAQHPYCQRKGLSGEPLQGLRVVPAGDPLRIGGRSMAGALVIPAYGTGGTLQSLQLIPADGPKMNLPGCPMAGASFTVGTPEPGAPLYLSEGVGQAWACWQATGGAAVCAFGWGSMGTVARDLRQRDSAARLVLVPDVGKEGDADKLARELGCSVARLPEGEPQNFDCNDLAQRDGADVLAELLEAAQQPAAPEADKPRLMPVDVAGVLTHPAPPPRFVWGQYLPAGVVSMLGAHGGTGKSTIALMLAVAAATGRELFGQATEQGRALFVSLEDGAAVVRRRLQHICEQWGIEPQEVAQYLAIVDGTGTPELYVTEGRGQGLTTATYAELQALAQGAALVIVDNASDAYAGDEIQRQQVRAFIRCLAEIARAEDCAVLLLAHVDKGTSRARKAEGGEGYSGSTAWHNSVRSRLFMARAEDGTLSLEHQKSNLGPLAAPLVLRWPHGGLPELDGPTAGIVAHIAERVDTTALLRLIAEFSGRGERVAVATTARTNAAKLLSNESTYPKGRKPGEVFDLLRRAQRAGYLEAVTYRGTDRHQREAWNVTAKGCEYAGLPPETAGTAGTAGTYEEPAPAAPAAGSAGTA